MGGEAVVIAHTAAHALPALVLKDSEYGYCHHVTFESDYEAGEVTLWDTVDEDDCGTERIAIRYDAEDAIRVFTAGIDAARAAMRRLS